MKNLNLYAVTDIDELAWPTENLEFTMHTPALAFFNDLTETNPSVIESMLSAVEAKKLMQKAHISMNFVVDDKNHFVGVISDEDLIDRKIMQQVSKEIRRDEVELTDLMVPKKRLKALDFDAIKTASIASIINALKHSGEYYCLVTDNENHKIRGIFSAHDISKKLGVPINNDEPQPYLRILNAVSEEKSFEKIAS